MYRASTIFVCGFIGIVFCTDYNRNHLTYRNLYGYEDDKTPINAILEKLIEGSRKFVLEGENFQDGQPRDSTPTFNQEYDFIVVGAGSAGATIAGRLSEIEDFTVLLIEAGPQENLVMDIPITVSYLQMSNDVNWKYQPEASGTFCLGMTNKKCNWPRGKVMGGSSVLNYMIATRGHPLDYDFWAEMGNQGWSYNELLKYFKKLESIGISELQHDKEMHNTNGPVGLGYPPYHTPLAESFLNAGLEMGYSIVDYNGKQNVGFSYIQATIKNGTRMSTNRAYLCPANKRKNLFITSLSHVNKVLIDPESKIAYGVEFTKSGVTIQVKAKKEVILSAGTIGSSQILMLSGVGPAQHLQEMKINVIQDAPVGENLMDHIAYGGLIFLVDQPVGIVASDLTDPLKPYLRDFLNKKDGPFTVPGGCEALAFIDLDNRERLDAFPNIELLFIGASIISNPPIRHTFGIADEYWSKMYSKIEEHYSWSIFPMLMRPKSKGKILLRNKNPRSKPKIFANYLDHPEDVRILVKGIRAAIEVSKTKAMQRFNTQLYDAIIPGCEDYKYDSDEYWECATRAFTFTIYHHSGTCKMTPESDPTGVVNPKLQVKGIQRLRVADASIMPMIITGHINIPVIMIGEKLADMVKEDWGYLNNIIQTKI